MKKVLFVLGLAVCTTAAMAQTTKMVPRVGEGPQKANIRMASNDRVDYKASIFTKDDDQVVYTFTFASDQMTGILYGAKDNAGMKSGDTVYVDGEATLINATNQHGRSESNTYWTRISTVKAISDTTSAEAVEFTTNYPQSRNYGAVNIPAYMGPQNGIEEDNGFMFISLIEYFNNTGKGDVNAYFQLPGVELPADAQILDIQWRQFHRKFYEDCHVDYKLNGKWNSVEVNVPNVDVNVNATSSSVYTLTLPAAAANQSKLELRFRVHGSDASQVYGYMWAIDNVEIIVPATPARWSFFQSAYLDGFYGTLPQGFNIPVTYAIYARNRGTQDLTGNKLIVSDVNADTTVIEAAQNDIATGGNPMEGHLFAVNERGFMVAGEGLNSSTGYYQAMPDYWESRAAYGEDASAFDSKYQRRGLPTKTPGKQMFAISAESTNGGLTRALDTMAYYVSPIVEESPSYGITVPGYRWGNDNSIVASNSEFAFQFTNDGYVTDDPSVGHSYQPDYEVFTRFNTPDVVPVDENGNPWVFRGIELVTATTLTSNDIDGIRLSPVCVIMAKNPDNNDSIGLYYMGNTGLSTEDVIVVDANSASDEIEYGVVMPGQKAHVVNMLLPAQPAIAPNTSYLFGYRNAEGGKFAVAGVNYAYYENADSLAKGAYTRYSANPNIKDFYRQFDPTYKVYDVYVADGVQNRSISGWNIDRYPLIHAIVGPKIQLPTYEVEMQCTDDTSYWITTGADESMCGMTDTIVKGSTNYYYVIPGTVEEMMEEGVYGEGGMVIDEIYLDGNAIDLNDENIVNVINYDIVDPEHDDQSDDPWPALLKRNYYRVTLRDAQANHTISAKASWHKLSITEAEDFVHIGMAPNPASSQVTLNVSGLTGKVNCSIIDMSGREIYASSFNAGSEQVINLSGVPAGAYFVRITNDTISKVEKLIVR